MLFTTAEAIIALLTGQTMQHLCNISTNVTYYYVCTSSLTYCTVLTVTQYIRYKEHRKTQYQTKRNANPLFLLPKKYYTFLVAKF